MSTNLKLEKFSGPLDLLLQLIENKELNITDIALAQVTEQYLSYLNQLGKDRPEKLADFLLVASKLVYLKSRCLLPYLYPEEEDDGPDLARQLRMYKVYVDAAKKINDLWQSDRAVYGREEPPLKLKEFVLPPNVGAPDLHASMNWLIQRLKPAVVLPKINIKHGLSVRQIISKISDILRRTKKILFSKMLGPAKDKTDIIVNFLAILELARQGKVLARQSQGYGEIEIERL